MFACPKCGKPESSYDGNTFCGPCEAAYRAEEADNAQQEIDQRRQAMDACTCAEGCCTECVRNYASILALQGDEAGAIAVINQ